MKHIFKNLIYSAAAVLLATASPALAGTATLDITPSSGTIFYTGQTLQLQVNISDIVSTSPFYAYTFDLAFDPTVFQAQSATDGTIFVGGSYFAGAIDNTAGLITFHSGLDLNQTFAGTGGLLGTFEFVPVAKGAVTGSIISVQNVAFQSFEGAQINDADITVGNLPSASFDVAVPEPMTGAMAAGALVALALAARRRL